MAIKRKLTFTRGLLPLLGALAILPTAHAQESNFLASIEERRLPQPLTATADQRAALLGTTGRQQVLVRLKTPSVAADAAASPNARLQQRSSVLAEQAAFMQRCARVAPNSRLLATTQHVLNSVVIEVDGADIEEIAKDSAVMRISRVRDYELHLSDTVPYVGAAAVQASGIDGSGVSVAVFDSGIDYLHADLGGSGSVADYAANNVDVIEPGTFPTTKVVGGFDFVGEIWPNGPLAPDPDPLDFEGHGSHVADIIGGTLGVAPGVDLYAVKVCSAVSSSCSGVALIQGMEFAVDPNGDGDTSDAVDIINMSLGADYGQPFDDDLAAAIDNASALGVLTVASAGNGGNQPYVTGTPAAAPTALSVAQTAVPSAFNPFVTVNGVDYSSAFQAWSQPPAAPITGPLVYGDGAGGNLDGCAPFAAGSQSGNVVLIDRGGCFFTTKIFNVEQAGGIAGIIGLVDGSAPFSGGFADPGGPITIPGYMVTLVDADIFRAAIAAGGATATLDPANGQSLAQSIVSSSARGPQHESTNLIKPEIGAPGASLSAEAGTGFERTVFGGTSGASPMVAGAAALLKQAEPGLGPVALKARLMAAAETNIANQDLTGPASITRIGAGELRADRAIDGPIAAWDLRNRQGALSFGFVDVARRNVFRFKTLRVKNFSSHTVRYHVSSSFRFTDDEANGAVSLNVFPRTVRIPAGRSRFVTVIMRIDGDKLPKNNMSSGVVGIDPATLTANEYDGYVTFDDGTDSYQVPWHVLPRKASAVLGRPRLRIVEGTDEVGLINLGRNDAQNSAFSLLATSPNLPEGGLGEQSPTPDIRAVGSLVTPVPAGFCSGSPSFLWQFAVTTWERQQHLVPVIHRLLLDINNDGLPDFEVANLPLSLFLGGPPIDDPSQVSVVTDLLTGSSNAFFFAEHATNTANTVLTICAEQLGLNATALGITPITVQANTTDFYFGGPGDSLPPVTTVPGGEQFQATIVDMAPGATETMTVTKNAASASADIGILLITNADLGSGARGGATRGTEALVFTE
ncbi:MAG: S8 family serine peptidase [Pseudomonadota bacterium]